MGQAWILLGMMGAGKSSVGRALAELSEREFFDTDVLIQQRLGRTIPQIFEMYGEQNFRDHESSILAQMSAEATVLATGGGIVLRPENWIEMRRLGTTVFLDAKPEVIVNRLEQSRRKRPLLESADWKDRVISILAERRGLYEQADHIIPITEDSLQDAAIRLFTLLGAK